MLRSTTRKSMPCRCIGCTRLDGLCHCHSSVVPSRGRTSIRVGSKPRSAICHCTPDGVEQREVPAAARVRRRAAPRAPHPAARDPRLLDAAAADDVEAHDVRRRRSPAVFCSTISEPGLNSRKSTSTSIRSAGCSGKLERATGRSSRPPSEAICSICAAVAELELVGARVGGVQEAQPVDPPLDRHPRRDRAVDQDRVAAEAEVDVLRVAERAVPVERVVGDHQRHVVLALRQLELLLALVASR